MLNLPFLAFLIIILTGQSNMVRSADAIAARLPGYTVVDCSVGGTSVTRWQRGDYIYDRCVDAVREQTSLGGVVVGILHFQGETDTTNYDTASQWYVLTFQFVTHFRTDIGVTAGSAPFIYARLGKKPTASIPVRDYWYLVKTKQLEMLADHPSSNFWSFSTYDLEPHCPVSGVHWCPDVYPIIADRFVTLFFESTGLIDLAPHEPK